jgi:hypothetical protein
MSTVGSTYQHQEYPKVLYGVTGQTALVKDAMEHAALGAGWAESPGEAAALVAPAVSTEAPAVLTASPAVPTEAPAVPTVAPAVPTRAETPAIDADAVDKAQAAGVHGAPVSVILEKLKGAPVEILVKVRGYEAQNPKGPRKSLTEALDVAIKAATAPVQA